MPNQNDINALLKELANTTEFDRKRAPALYEFVEEAAKKLGIRGSIKIQHSTSHLLGAIPTKMFKGIDHHYLLISDGILSFFESSDLSKPLSAEMKALIGHELSHISDGVKPMLFRRGHNLPFFALPVAFSVGYYILDKAWRTKEHSEDKSMSLTQAVKQVVIDEKLGLQPQKQTKKTDGDAYKAHLYEELLRMGGTVAAAAVGFGATLGLARHISLAAEFRADRVGAMLAGPEAMQSALQKLHSALDKPVKITITLPQPKSVPNINTAFNELWERTKTYVEQERKMFVHKDFIAPHPTGAQRELALKALKPSADFRTRIADSVASAIPPNLSV